MEIEVPASKPQAFSHITRNKRHMLQLETVLMTVYYPASIDQEEKLPKKGSRFSRELWLGRPRISIAEGYGRFAGVGPVGIPIMLPTMFTKLPAFRNAPPADYWAPEVDTKKEGTKVKHEHGPKPNADAPNEPAFPVLLFSHGLGGTRTMYSSVCGEFASYGFVVVAVEHRDGSGPRTYINHARQGEGTMTDLERRGGLDHHHYEKARGFAIIDYIFPKDNPMDTSPNNDKGVDTELRRAQMDLRMAELEEAFSVLREINDGHGKMIADRNLRQRPYKGSSSHGLQGVDWSQWKDRMQMHHVTMAGHSFGAATTVEVLRSHGRFDYVSQGIIYDIWGAGTRPADDDRPEHRISAPILAINSEAFTYWPSNFELVESVIKEAQTEPIPSPSWLMTLRGTVHISQSDFSLLYPNICSLFLKMVANPRRALDLNVNASLEFLDQTLPRELAQVNRAYKNEGLLEAELSPLERIPSSEMHKPKDEKYIAAKLHIQHEWIYRISPKAFRQLKRVKNHSKGKEPTASDEVWLHMKPSQDSMEEYLRRTTGRSPSDAKLEKTDDGTAEGEPVKAQPLSEGRASLGQPNLSPDLSPKQ